MKRARSVAIFSLKLKERRAKEAAEGKLKDRPSPSGRTPVDNTPTTPIMAAGELSCIPIEKLIQVDDVSRQLQQQQQQHQQQHRSGRSNNHSSGGQL